MNEQNRCPQSVKDKVRTKEEITRTHAIGCLPRCRIVTSDGRLWWKKSIEAQQRFPRESGQHNRVFRARNNSILLSAPSRDALKERIRVNGTLPTLATPSNEGNEITEDPVLSVRIDRFSKSQG